MALGNVDKDFRKGTVMIGCFAVFEKLWPRNISKKKSKLQRILEMKWIKFRINKF